MKKIWLWPVLIAFSSGIGLLAGLISESIGDWLAWAALTWPVALSCYALKPAKANNSGVRSANP